MLGVKYASASQLDYHIKFLDAELRGKLTFIAHAPRHPESTKYRVRCRVLRSMIEKSRREYQRKTGKAYYYEHQSMPVMIVGDANAVATGFQATKKREIGRLVYLGQSEARRMQGMFNHQLNNFYKNGFINLIIANWVAFFGGTHPQTLRIKGQNSFPKIFKLLRDADAAVQKADFEAAHHKLALAAKEMKEIHELYAEFMRRIQSGSDSAIMVIKFYSAVATGAAGAGATIGGGAGMTAVQQASVAGASEGSFQVSSLALQSINGHVSAKDISRATFDIALAGTTALGGKKLADMLSAIAPTIGQRIAAKAVDRYFQGFGHVNPKFKAEVLKKVSEVVRSRITAIGMTAFKKAINQITNFPEEPTFNFWENLFAPLVGNGLEEIIKVYVSQSDEFKQKIPTGSK